MTQAIEFGIALMSAYQAHDSSEGWLEKANSRSNLFLHTIVAAQAAILSFPLVNWSIIQLLPISIALAVSRRALDYFGVHPTRTASRAIEFLSEKSILVLQVANLVMMVALFYLEVPLFGWMGLGFLFQLYALDKTLSNSERIAKVRDATRFVQAGLIHPGNARSCRGYYHLITVLQKIAPESIDECWAIVEADKTPGDSETLNLVAAGFRSVEDYADKMKQGHLVAVLRAIGFLQTLPKDRPDYVDLKRLQESFVGETFEAFWNSPTEKKFVHYVLIYQIAWHMISDSREKAHLDPLYAEEMAKISARLLEANRSFEKMKELTELAWKCHRSTDRAERVGILREFIRDTIQGMSFAKPPVAAHEPARLPEGRAGPLWDGIYDPGQKN